MQRSEIILAAAQIFREKGYHGTSMWDIADSVGLRKPSLYHHVSSKQELLVSVLDLALDMLIEQLTEVLNSDLDPPTKLRTAMRVYIQQLAEEIDLATVLLLEHRNLDPENHREHIARRDRFEGLWRSLIAEGVEAGTYRSVDVSIISFALLGVQNWMITWYRPNGVYDADEVSDQFCDLFLTGLLLPNRERQE